MDGQFIRKEVSLNKVKDVYRPVVEEVMKSFLELTDGIHSIYLYGSVATGKAKSPSSDLDILVILKEPPSSLLTNAFNDLGREHSLTKSHLFREVGLGVTDLSVVLYGGDPLGWRFFIQILCVRLYGEELYDEEPLFRPTTALARELQSDMAEAMRRAVERIRATSREEQRIRIQGAMKKIIRAAFGLVMERENHWTVDLDEMAELFCKHYPEQEKNMEIVVQLLRAETPSEKEAIFIIEKFGYWVKEELFR